MNYRERMLRQMWHNDLAHHTQQWQQERNILINDLITLQNSVDVTVVEGLTKENQVKDKQIKALTILANSRQEKLEQEKQALINLAKQKIKNQKEARELLTQIEQNWTQERDTWKREREELAEQHHQELTQKETDWQNKADHWQENKNFLEQQIQDWDQQITKQKQAHQDLSLLQQKEIKNLNQQLNQAHLKEKELNKIITQKDRENHYQEERLQGWKSKSQEKEKQLTHQQNQIKELQQNNLNLQEKITNLTQTTTEQTQTIANQLTQINLKDAKLTKQKGVLEQLLTNHQARLNQLGGEYE